MKRRKFIFAGLGLCSATILSTSGWAMFGTKNNKSDKKFPFELSDNEWRERLSSGAYDVLRNHATERSGSSSLDKIYSQGTYHCAGCDQKLFSSTHKFDSHTGWPSFSQPLDGINSTLIGKSADNKLWMKRTEVHCTNCGGHQGHVFPDGPKPTGLRYCINGVAMVFKSS